MGGGLGTAHIWRRIDAPPVVGDCTTCGMSVRINLNAFSVNAAPTGAARSLGRRAGPRCVRAQ